MRNASILLIVGLAILGASTLRAADPEDGHQQRKAGDPAKPLFKFGQLVAIPTTASDELKAEAERLSRILGKPPGAVLLLDKNPTCCFWIELWHPNPSADGYVVIIQPGGGQIVATDMDALKHAIDHVERSIKENHGFSPVGVLTNYPTATAHGAQPN